ncbi:PREDICTED: protein DEFECTIVE IN MERISTEM SILENCING 3-like isoform X3 [Ipomoea nil]|uniref:protein DEFECTIVE IN MERISTEM SILENCING 3-like isoform X3 n=1 Tax=Ipomoea nil TaxID=35883 RepID=UPI000901E039|nr:PREDICTED: protein DEFECTIVE IN MERISTEM SILENCING 3-like isoform X3 [Ipomoea nil]
MHVCMLMEIFSSNRKALAAENSSMMNPSQNNSFPHGGLGVQNGPEVLAAHNAQEKQDALKESGMQVKHYADNVKFLKSHINMLDDSVVDLQVALGKYHSASVPTMVTNDLSHPRCLARMFEHILRHEKSAAGILCQLKALEATQAYNHPLSADVVGIVATLGTVDDDNLSRILSDYLGSETMLAVVCKTYDGVRALETYNHDGFINKSSGLHGLGTSTGMSLDGRFLAICLESLSPFAGNFIADDPEKRLDLQKPRLPNGQTPPGFLGFAVNMINVDSNNVYCVTSSDCGLRETLFYALFSSLQVYKTRAEMLRALPCINNGAVSLDGGMIKRNGIYSLGNREVDVEFPKTMGTLMLPESYVDIENRLKEMRWKKERALEDLHREQALLDCARKNFEVNRQKFLKTLVACSSYTNLKFWKLRKMSVKDYEILKKESEVKAKEYKILVKETSTMTEEQLNVHLFVCEKIKKYWAMKK